VVVPSVSRAAVPQPTAVTVFVETPSSPTLSNPVDVPGSNELPTEGAGATVGTWDGGSEVAGGDPTGVCWANVEEGMRTRAAPTKRVIMGKYIESSFEIAITK